MLGKLDKLRAAEQELVLRAKRPKAGVPSFGVMRIGKLRAGYALCDLSEGDALSGEVSPDAVVEVALQSLVRAEAVNATFSLGPAGRDGGTELAPAAHWDDQFLKLVGPEVYRRPLRRVGASEAATFLREWARRFLRPAEALTTPVAVHDVDDGVLLRFLTRASGYGEFDDDETDDQKWAAAKPGAAESKAGKPDGALLLVAESRPSPRVRVARAEMGEGAQPKEMSEAKVLTKLDADLQRLEKARG